MRTRPYVECTGCGERVSFWANETNSKEMQHFCWPCWIRKDEEE